MKKLQSDCFATNQNEPQNGVWDFSGIRGHNVCHIYACKSSTHSDTKACISKELPPQGLRTTASRADLNSVAIQAQGTSL
jgi:hypothetical protein